MKIVAIILNLILLITSIILFIDEMGHIDSSMLLMFSLFIGCPVINLFVLLRYFRTTDSWICLYLKRKALEERKKIEALNSSKEESQQLSE